MALASKDRVGGNLPPFFRAKDHVSDLALIFEPLSVREGVEGQYGPKDHVRTKVTVFRTQEALDKGNPNEETVYEINDTVLARDLKELLNDAKRSGDPSPALIASLGQWKSKKNGGNPSWVFRQPKDADYEKAAAYYSQREAALQAALDSVPDF